MTEIESVRSEDDQSVSIPGSFVFRYSDRPFTSNDTCENQHDIAVTRYCLWCVTLKGGR